MLFVVVTALGIGCATVVGALIGFCVKKIPHRWNDGLLGFAAGVMLAAAIVGLILPAAEMIRPGQIWIVAVGIFAGAIFLNLMDFVVPHLHRLSGIDIEQHPNNEQISRVLLFVLAVAIHNLPEGLAAGVAFGGQNIGNAVSIAAGIALQNVPEGMIIISPMLLAGFSGKRTFAIALSTGLVEVAGTIIGYFAAMAASAILPFALAFAGGTMLYLVGDEMIPETHSHGYEKTATFSLLAGFVLMIGMDVLIQGG